MQTVERNTQNPGDNVYYKQVAPPQAYVPYAPVNPPRLHAQFTPSYVPGDDAMMVLAITGLAVTMLFGLPIGIFTGPAALRRANKLERLVNAGRRPRTDSSSITGARIMAWLSIAVSALVIAIFVLVIAVALMGARVM